MRRLAQRRGPQWKSQLRRELHRALRRGPQGLQIAVESPPSVQCQQQKQEYPAKLLETKHPTLFRRGRSLPNRGQMQKSLNIQALEESGIDTLESIGNPILLCENWALTVTQSSVFRQLRQRRLAGRAPKGRTA